MCVLCVYASVCVCRFSSVSMSLGELISKYEGSISAEHGVGLLKKESLRFSRSEDEINLMKSIKKIFDPNAILNPGKLI